MQPDQNAPVPSPVPIYSPKKHYHFIGPTIVFVLCVSTLLYFLYLSGRPISSEFVIGAASISAVITGAFSLVAFGIRKIGMRFGKRWAIFSWSLVIVLPFVALGSIYRYETLPSLSTREFLSNAYYEAAPQDWKTYINDRFDLSLRYPPAMALDETPDAWGHDDMYGVNLEGSSTQGESFSLDISATTDQSKCADLVANTTYMPLSSFTDTKAINGREYLVKTDELMTVYGLLNTFAYVEKDPICKVAVVAYRVPSQKADAAVDIVPMLTYAESIIGSMDTGVKDTGDPNTMFAGESKYALGMELTRIDGARLAAFRVYKYNPDGSSKAVKSYVGTCEDKAFTSLNPDMTCRESKNAFIMYFKMDNRYGYACGDADWSGIVATEPTGLTCNPTSKASVPAISAKSTANQSSASRNSNASIYISSADLASLTAVVNSFKQAFLNDDEQGVLRYASAASQNMMINQMNTAYSSLTIKSISGINTEAEVVMAGVTNTGASKDIAWGFVKENGRWRFDLGMTMQMSQQI